LLWGCIVRKEPQSQISRGRRPACPTSTRRE
jgi:hypothetical protein